MKISYRTNSAIRIIEDGFKHALVCNDDLEDIQQKKIAKDFEKNVHNFKDIKIITKPFYEAMEKSIGKILESDLFNNEYSDFGTFVFKTAEGIAETYCYNFTIKNREFSRLVFFYFQGSSLIKYANKDNDSEYICSELTDLHPMEEGSTIMNQVRWMFEFYLFTKFCKVETTTLSAGQKVNGIKCKYKNDTSSNIKILDSTWFTNLVKSDEFKVRGHFRLQPKKEDGEWTKELIWITEFKKHGYTAPARKISLLN